LTKLGGRCQEARGEFQRRDADYLSGPGTLVFALLGKKGYLDLLSQNGSCQKGRNISKNMQTRGSSDDSMKDLIRSGKITEGGLVSKPPEKNGILSKGNTGQSEQQIWL